MRIATILCTGLALGACTPAAPVVHPEVVIAARGALPTDPGDPAWNSLPAHVAPLILQDMVEPRLLEVSTRSVRVEAATDGARLAVRLSWSDATGDDLPLPSQFPDACAIQLPTRIAADVPAPQMGEPGRPVEIVLWRASWQAMVDGRPDTLKALYENASVDHYPFQAPSLPEGSQDQRAMEARYAPARALGNPMAGPRERPVEDLIATGPGTLQPAARTLSAGRGQRTADGWSVVLIRPMPADLSPGTRTQIAFAVWEGSHQEVGARKMRTGWIPMILELSP